MSEDNVISGPPGIDLPDTSLGEFILDKLAKNSLRIIQVDAKSGQILTSHELLEKSVRLAVALEERGIKSGDTIAISSESNCDWFVVVCGALFCGVCVAPMNPAYLDDEINHCLNITKPRIIFVSQKTASIVHRVAKKVSWNIELIQFDDTIDSINIPTLKDIIGKSRQWPNSFFYQAAKVTRPAEKEAVILYSSGTTGLPKGVMLSHRNMLAIIYALGAPQCLGNWTNSPILFILPFFHGYGLATMLTLVTFGGTAVVMQGFDPQLFCATVQKYRIEYIPLVPPIMVFLAKHPMVLKFDFTSIKEIICGAAPLPREILNAVKQRFNDKIVIRNGYGMTELSVAISISSGSEEKPETVGPLVPGTQCKVIDPTTLISLGPGESGELCFKGDHNMIGYKNNYEATRDTIDNNGWLHTGDLGYYDNDGYIYVVGRLKELIKYNGFQISPSEIESYLLKHPDVVDAAVIGKDDENCGQIPVAFVVKRPKSTVTADELRLYIDERVSSQKRLRGGVKFIAAIPKNSNGKILRKELEKFFSKL